jgi:hypothetical protein
VVPGRQVETYCHPYTTSLLFEEAWDTEVEALEFRLVYEGPLPAQKSGGKGCRLAEKHAIRKALHPQLRELWSQVPGLSHNLDFFAGKFRRDGFNYVPLINAVASSPRWCKLDILFLRRDAPGNLISSGGDIDNRIKVLFDGLRMTSDLTELGGAVPGPDEDPFFCLLQDDRAIIEVNITTDRLLTPSAPNRVHDVALVIRVRTPMIDFDDT